MKLYVVVEVSPDEQDFPIYCHEDKNKAERFIVGYKKDRPNCDWSKRPLKVVEYQRAPERSPEQIERLLKFTKKELIGIINGQRVMLGYLREEINMLKKSASEQNGVTK